MCVGLAVPSLNDRTRSLLDAGVAGVLLHGVAFSEPSAVAEVSHQIKSYAGRRVFVAVDHEAAQNHAEGSSFSLMPPAQVLGESDDVELARSTGQLLGRELRAVGVDLTLGPVVDVATRRDAPSICDRSLSANSQVVARLATALIEGQQSEGVAACAKHFPGHGDTTVDSNVALPRLAHGLGRLDEVELRPFRAAIAASVAGIMVGHLLFEAFDGSRPASMSRALIFGLLRQKMSYRGLVLIDDIDMVALSRKYTRRQIAELGVASGADCFLCAQRPESAFELIGAIDEGVRKGTILPERIEAARRRIAPLLHRYFHDPGGAPDLSLFSGKSSHGIVDRGVGPLSRGDFQPGSKSSS